MNILIINHYAGAPHLGRELRPYFFAKNWQKAGHHVSIAAADHTHLRSNAPVEGHEPELRRIGEVSYLFFPTPRYNDSIAGRGRNIAAFVKGLWQNAPSLAAEVQPDVVIAQSGYPYDFFPAQRIAGLCGAKTVLEVRDLWPLQLQDHYRYPPTHAAVRFAEYMLGRAVSSADHVVRVLPNSMDYLAGYGLKREKSSLILSGIAAKNRKLEVPAGKAEKLARFKGDGLLVMYCGNIGINHDLEDFVESANLVGENIRLVLVGNGGNKIMLKRRVRQLSLHNLMFVDGVMPNQVSGMLELADLLYFPLRPTRQARYGIASAKLLSYMLAGKPVICDGSTPGNPVAEADCGLVLEKHGPQEIAGAIRMLANMEEPQRNRMGRRGREYVLQNRDYSLLAAEYLELLKKLAEKS